MQRRGLLLAGLASPLARGAPAAGATHAPMVFPADFRAHPDSRSEWWYVTGELAAEGREYGFQLTFFRSRTDVPLDHPSRFAASQLIFAHAAVTDLAGRRLRHDQRAARAGFGIASAQVGETRVHLRDWSFVRDGSQPSSRYRAELRSETAGFTLELDLAATQPVLLQGDAGWSRKGPDPDQGSHYYSEPHLQASGRMILDGRAHQVGGRAWLDHEWSDGYLPDGAVGWDWIGMNLDDGSALMAFRMRRADGSTLWTGGSWRSPGRPPRSFTADEVHFTPLRRWRSASSQAEYPVAWLLEIPQGSFEVRARLDDQELDSRGSTGAIYWEGTSDLLDAQGRRVGRGYLEMTGYASALRM